MPKANIVITKLVLHGKLFFPRTWSQYLEVFKIVSKKLKPQLELRRRSRLRTATSWSSSLKAANWWPTLTRLEFGKAVFLNLVILLLRKPLLKLKDYVCMKRDGWEIQVQNAGSQAILSLTCSKINIKPGSTGNSDSAVNGQAEFQIIQIAENSVAIG